MSKPQRGSMSRKSPTQIELEAENDRLKKENSNLKKKLKRTIKQLHKYEDIQSDITAALEAEDEARFEDLFKPPEKPTTDDFIVITLPDGCEKRIRKRN